MSKEHDEGEQPRIVVNDRRRIDPETGQVRSPFPDGPAADPADPAQAAQPLSVTVTDEALEAAKAEAAERTADLQRLSAEYANYRKRVDRDRVEIGALARAKVLTDLLPVLDDLDRAEAHGDLTGAFKSVADKLTEVLGRLGLTGIGAVGEVFDPSVHEAVHFLVSPDVTEQTVSEVLRRGYQAGERQLRPATVVVTGPDPDAPAEAGE